MNNAEQNAIYDRAAEVASGYDEMTALNIGHGVPLPPTKQGSQEWLGQRRYGIGGSDVAAIMGAVVPHRLSLSPWSGPHDVYASKVRGIDSESSIAMECGHLLEPLVMSELAKATGLDIITDVPSGYYHPDYEWCRGSLDGVVLDSDGVVVAGAEGKTSSDYAWPDGPPVYYLAQVQWYMWVLGLDRFYVGCIFGKSSFDWWIVEADPAFQADLLAAALDFWIDCIIPEEPPGADWSASCVGNLVAAQAIEDNAKAKTLEPLDGELDALLIERQGIKDAIDEAKKASAERLKTCDALIMAGMTHRRHIGSTHKVTLVTRTALDRSALEAAHPDAWADCQVETPATSAVSVQLLKARHPDLVAEFTKPTHSHLRTTEIK